MTENSRRVNGKLVRERIPEIISASGAVPGFWTLSDEEFLGAVVGSLGLTLDDVQAAADLKRSARGGFHDRLWLQEVVVD